MPAYSPHRLVIQLGVCKTGALNESLTERLLNLVSAGFSSCVHFVSQYLLDHYSSVQCVTYWCSTSHSPFWLPATPACPPAFPSGLGTSWTLDTLDHSHTGTQPETARCFPPTFPPNCSQVRQTHYHLFTHPPP